VSVPSADPAFAVPLGRRNPDDKSAAPKGAPSPRWLERLREGLLIIYLVVLPVSVAAGNVFGVLLLAAAWARPVQAWRRLRACLSPGLIAALLALPVVVVLFSLGVEPGQGQMWEMITKQRKLLLLTLAPIACQSVVTFARARLAVWTGASVLAVLTWAFMIAGQGLHGPFDPEVPVTITHTYQNFIVGFSAVWLAAWLLSNHRRLKRWQFVLGITALAVMVGSVLFIVTGRAGQAAFAVMAVVAVFTGMRQGRWAAAAVLVGLVAVALAASPQIRDRWLSIADSFDGATNERALPGTVRLHYLANTATLIREAPILGHGTGQFPIVYARVSEARQGSHFAATHPHADLLLYWAEAGLAGAAALLALYLGLLRAASRLPDEAALALRVLIAGFVVGGLAYTFQLDYVSGAYFYSVAGLLLAAPRAAAATPGAGARARP
jgi:O-antigen ligase